MASFRIARPAMADLQGIGRYTRKRWGLEQARRYLGDLGSCFHRLADRPELGRSADRIRPGLWCLRQGHHVIYYRRTEYGVRVIRGHSDRTHGGTDIEVEHQNRGRAG